MPFLEKDGRTLIHTNKLNTELETVNTLRKRRRDKFLSPEPKST